MQNKGIKEHPMAKLRVVVVDDEPIIRMDLKSMLTNAGYDVVGEGADGFDAIQICEEKKPDVAILDIKMKDLDGLSAASYIKEKSPSTAIIMLTAFSKGTYIDKAKEYGISTYLVKPINEKLLVPNIELAVARHQELLEYREDLNKINEKLEVRKLIEKAKGMLMKEKGISEDEAYNYIRNLSKTRNISMKKIAELIIDSF